MTTSRKARRDRRRPKEETRQTLLEAGRQLLMERGYPQAIPIRLAEVVDRAGHTTGAAYQIWDNQREYQEDLALYVARTFQWAAPNASLGDDDLPAMDELTFEEAVSLAGRRYFETFVAREDFYIAIRLYSVRNRSQKLNTAIANGYDTVHDDLVALFEAFLRFHRRRLRDPYTIDDLAVAITGITEGLALRHRVQPGRIRSHIRRDGQPWHLYSTVLLALLEHYSEPADREPPAAGSTEAQDTAAGSTEAQDTAAGSTEAQDTAAGSTEAQDTAAGSTEAL
jgi:AcrR family transcriptional regulator